MTLATQVRLQQVHRRLLKKTYKGFNAIDKRIIKLIEHRQYIDVQLDKLSRCLKYDFGENWRHLENAKKTTDYKIYMELCLDIIKTSEKLSRIEKKYNRDSENVFNMFYLLNVGRGTTSF